MLSSSSIVRSAIERAESRASVLNSLEKSYGNLAQQKNPKKQASPAATAQPSGIGSSSSSSGGGGNGGRQIQSIQSFVGDQREKTRKALFDSLFGKSIVLTNLKSQIDASKSAKKTKSALGKLTAQRASKSKLKRLAPNLSDPMVPPLKSDLHTLNTLWCMYISGILTGAQSEAQLQARLITCEMVGARVVVVESGTVKCKGSDKGLKGTISAISKKCYYIAHQKMVVAPPSALLAAVKASNRTTNAQDTSSVLPDIDAVASLACDLAPTISYKSAGVSSDIFSSTEYVNTEMMGNEAFPTPVRKRVWVSTIAVRKVLRSSCVLAVLLPPPRTNKAKKRDRHGAVQGDGGSDPIKGGRICLLHGSEHMPFTKSM